MDPRLEPTLIIPKSWIEDDFGTEPPNENALRNAEDALQILDAMGFPPQHIGPDVDSGVLFNWQVGEYRASISFYNEAAEDPTDIVALISDGTGMHIRTWCVEKKYLRSDLKCLQLWTTEHVWERTGSHRLHGYFS